MSVLFLEYPKCSTCKKAKKWLDEKGISYTDRHIVEEHPTAEELKEGLKSLSEGKYEISEHDMEEFINGNKDLTI